MGVSDSFYVRFAYWVNIKVRPLLTLYEAVGLFHPQNALLNTTVTLLPEERKLASKLIFAEETQPQEILDS